MHVISCTVVVVAVTAAAIAAGSTSSSAVVVEAAGAVGWSAGGDASMCFTIRSGGVTAGMATASGLVTIPGPRPDIGVDLPVTTSISSLYLLAPNTVVSDVHPIASTSGFSSLCVGGAGGTATGGSVTFTIDLHSATDDYASAVTCTYSAGGPDWG